RPSEKGLLRHAVVPPRARPGALAKCKERGVALLERDERTCKTGVRIEVAMLTDELAIRALGLTQAAAREELRGGIAGEAMVVRGLRPRGATLLGERLRELAGFLVVHDPGRGEPRPLREREDMGPLDSVRVDAHGVELAREERRRGRTEVFLRDAQELKGERVHPLFLAGASGVFGQSV